MMNNNKDAFISIIHLLDEQLDIIKKMIPEFYKNDQTRFKGTVKEYFEYTANLIKDEAKNG